MRVEKNEVQFLPCNGEKKTGGFVTARLLLQLTESEGIVEEVGREVNYAGQLVGMLGTFRLYGQSQGCDVFG
jgi:hypothetical protein